MSRKEEKLLLLKTYFDTRRGVGHTLAMVHGVANVPATVIVGNPLSVRHIEHMAHKKVEAVSWEFFKHHLRGLRGPLVIDNAAMSDILGDALEIMRDLRSKIHLLEEEVHTLKEERSMSSE